eukprot:jgi/Orpsp1_1/1190933/evm.model.d7180000082268.1
MKHFIFIFNFLIIMKSILVRSIYNNMENNNIKYKRDSASGECSNINEFIGQTSSFDCCTLEGITCENNHITKILLSQTDLNGALPASIGNLTFLKELELNSCQLKGSIPKEIGNLSNLQILDIYDNQLTGEIPPEIGKLTNLTK